MSLVPVSMGFKASKNEQFATPSLKHRRLQPELLRPDEGKWQRLAIEK